MFFFIEDEEPPVEEEEIEEESGVRVSIGTFRASPHGIQATLLDPLSSLSGDYSWDKASTGIVAVTTLLTGVGPTSVIDMLSLSDQEKDRLSKMIGRVDVVPDADTDVIYHDSPVLDDLDKIFEWCSSIAGQCPSSAAAKDLRRIRSLRDHELESFIKI